MSAPVQNNPNASTDPRRPTKAQENAAAKAAAKAAAREKNSSPYSGSPRTTNVRFDSPSHDNTVLDPIDDEMSEHESTQRITVNIQQPQGPPAFQFQTYGPPIPGHQDPQFSQPPGPPAPGASTSTTGTATEEPRKTTLTAEEEAAIKRVILMPPRVAKRKNAPTDVPNARVEARRQSTFSPIGRLTFVPPKEKPEETPSKRTKTSDQPNQATGAEAAMTDEPLPVPPPPTKEQVEAEKKARNDAMALFRERFARPIQEEEIRVLRRFKTKEARYAPHQKWMKWATQTDQSCREFMKATDEGKPWLWGTIVDKNEPSLEDVDGFREVLDRLEALQWVKGFKSSDYIIRTWTRKPRVLQAAFAVFCIDQKAANALLSMGGLALTTEKRDLAFILQDTESWGSAVILDIEGAPDNEEEVIRGLMQSLSDIIDFEEETASGKPQPKSLHIARIEWEPKTTAQVVATGNRSSQKPGPPSTATAPTPPPKWRVKFQPDPTKMQDWMIPTVMGNYGSTGEVSLRVPPYCTTCNSRSHERNRCCYWRVPKVKLDPKVPDNFKETIWKSWSAVKATTAQTKKTKPTGSRYRPEEVSMETDETN